MIITLLLFTRITTWIKQIEVLLVIWKSKILPDWLLPVLIADLLLKLDADVTDKLSELWQHYASNPLRNCETVMKSGYWVTRFRSLYTINK